MTFKLPEITYPLTIGTIGVVLATGHEIHATCCGCRRYGRVNLVRVAKRSPLGLEQPTLRLELLAYVSCQVCDDAGRDGKDLIFTFMTPADHCEWPREQHEWHEDIRRARSGSE
ncbi:MAG TPA: hypothetical protein VGV39_04490 [Mesorhizobium sp.]|jgi:type II secretory ATPase GspE/PulE/Tfp pilus assembly ATPase PilB-like protein|uniref:hypothetical protein n=1 Tax=Mesorhizobium sp. TaxID=1871066 RepID=UPI002DDD4283|nr:hypothetical protein [Mesorhizobium sp.]HEV2502306.1 hypothetical protein [Mesorhizobium sp.]